MKQVFSLLFEKFLGAYCNRFPYPYWIYLSISHRCNFDCLMCGVKNVEKEVELPTEVVKKVIDEIADWPNEKVLMFTGGEPLLVKDIFNLVSYAVSKGVTSEMVSNGSLIDREIAEEIILSRLQNIAISLDGAKPETHEFIRNRKGSYERAIRAIKNLVAAKQRYREGPQISVWTTMMNHNICELYEIALLAKELGVECLVYHPVILNQVEMQKTYYGGPLWPEKDKIKLLEIQIKRLLEFKRKYGIIAFLHDPYLFLDYYRGKIKRKQWSCIPYVFLAIGPNGQVRICGEALGNIKDSSIEQILLSQPASRQRYEMLKCKKPCLQTCWALPEYYSLRKIVNNFWNDIKILDFTSRRNNLTYAEKTLERLHNMFRREKLKLREVILSLTSKCNLSCKMCSIPKKHKTECLDAKDIKRLIDSLKLLGVKTLVFSGGEPLLRDDIYEICAYAVKNNIDVCITTNGMLLNNKSAELFKKIGIKVVNISLDGDERTHDYLRGKGSFQKAFSALLSAKGEGLNVTIATVITRYNYQQLPYIIRIAKQLGIDTVKLQPFSTLFLDDADNKREQFFINSYEEKILQEKIKEFVHLAEEFDIKINPHSYLCKLPAYLSKRKITPPSFCLAPYTSAAVDSQGNLYPCWGLDLVIGNIKNEDFHILWLSERRYNLLKHILKYHCPGCLMSCYDNIYEKSLLKEIFLYYLYGKELLSKLFGNISDIISLARLRANYLTWLAGKVEDHEFQRYNSFHSSS